MRLLVTLILIFSSTFINAGNAMVDKQQALDAFNDRFNESVAEFDMDKFLSLYTDDTLWIAPASAPVAGHEEPRKLFQFLIDNKGTLTHTVDRLFISDDGSQAVMIGTADVLVEATGLDAKGTYLFVLEQKEKEWKIVTDMWHQHTKKE